MKVLSLFIFFYSHSLPHSITIIDYCWVTHLRHAGKDNRGVAAAASSRPRYSFVLKPINCSYSSSSCSCCSVALLAVGTTLGISRTRRPWPCPRVVSGKPGCRHPQQLNTWGEVATETFLVAAFYTATVCAATEAA